MRILLGVIVCGLLVATVGATSQAVKIKPSEFNDATYGYSLQPPKFPKAEKGQGVLVANFFGPFAEGAADNVTVDIQPLTTTPKEVRERHLEEIKKLELKVNSEKNVKQSGRDAWLVDYEGKVNGLDLRFLALTLFDGDRAISVTCVSKSDHFAAIEAEFRACLESLKVP